METGEPAAATDVGVDIYGVAEVEGEGRGFLSGVAADHDLAGLVGERSAKFFVNEGKRVLFGDGNVVLQIGVNEDVGVGFVGGLGVTDEVPVGIGDGVESIGTVRFQSGTASPGFKPVGEISFVDGGEQKFFLMVAVEEGRVVLFLNSNEEFDDSLGVGATINVVADEDEVVFRLRGNDSDHLLQGVEAAVDVADDKCSHNARPRGNGLRAES